MTRISAGHREYVDMTVGTAAADLLETLAGIIAGRTAQPASIAHLCNSKIGCSVFVCCSLGLSDLTGMYLQDAREDVDMTAAGAAADKLSEPIAEVQVAGHNLLQSSAGLCTSKIYCSVFASC
jgi:hypothetical protein